LKPVRRLGEVLRNTGAAPVHHAEVKLSDGIPLFCGFRKPFHGDDVIAGDAFASLIHFADVVLRRSKTLSGSLPE
jgi:hypothetical protein